MPVPYNLGFELNILVKLNDDALQIVEQILPYFQPSFNVTVDLVNVIGEKRDIPIVLDNISFQDDYEGDFATRRALIYTLNFTAKTYLFGPVSDSSEGLIKKVQVDYHASVNTETARRELRFSATPQARQDYDNDNTAELKTDLSKTKTRFDVSSTLALSVGMRIIIDKEIMKIKEIVDANTITVFRGYQSVAATHVAPASIDVLTTADDLLVEPDDDFGFNGVIEEFTDSRSFSPTQPERHLMNTMTNYDSIDKALNTSSAIDVTPSSKPQKVESTKDDVKKDYDYTRANLYSLVEKGQEALNGI